MLTQIFVHSQWGNLDMLVLNVINAPETDLLEVRNIEGLGSVTAEINTVAKGSIDGENFLGSNVGKRNIVFTLGLNPDWNEWTVSRLRRLLDKYFTPKQTVRLIFNSMEFSPVEISGHIESNEPNLFSKDPEHVISIICPDLYFKSTDLKTISSQTDSDPITSIDYEGNVETGFLLEVSKLSGSNPGSIDIFTFNTGYSQLNVDPAVAVPFIDDTHKLSVNSVPGEKHVRSVEDVTEEVTNLLNSSELVQGGNKWPTIGPGTQLIEIIPDQGIQEWTITYRDLFGSL